jgi:hypothetical protein
MNITLKSFFSIAVVGFLLEIMMSRNSDLSCLPHKGGLTRQIAGISGWWLGVAAAGGQMP